MNPNMMNSILSPPSLKVSCPFVTLTFVLEWQKMVHIKGIEHDHPPICPCP